MNWAHDNSTVPPADEASENGSTGNVSNAHSLVVYVLQNYSSNDDQTAAAAAPVTNWWRERVQVAPDWNQLWKELRWTWQLHIYGLASLFVVLACASFFTVLGLRAQLAARPHLTSLNVFLCLLGTSRALGLFIDPYASKKTMPALMSIILWDLAFPCLLSAFSMLQLAFLQMTQIKVASPRLSNETCVSLIITSHFSLIIASDILWALQNTLRMVWLITQVTFSVWGLFVCFTFLCGCMRLLRSVIKLPVIFLSQADSVGYENKGVVPLKKLKKGPLHPINNKLHNSAQKALAPKIRITDENNQTFSYPSDASQPNLTEIPPGESTPCSPSLHGPISPSSIESDQDVGILQSPGDLPHKVNTGNSCFIHKDDPAPSELLMKGKKYQIVKSAFVDDQGEQGPMLPFQKQPLTVSTLHKGTMFVQQSLRISSQLRAKEDYKFNAHKLKPSRRSRVEKLLRRILAVAFLGVLLCLLQGYGVFGPHGLSAGHRTAEIIPWFSYQTLCRIVELSMGCFMTVITRHTLHNHCHHTCGIGIKHRGSLFT